MPSLYKRGDTYYVAFHDATRRPNRKHVSLRVSGYRAARAKAARLTAEYEAGLFCPWTPPAKKDPASLGEAIQAFLKTRANLSKQSIQKYHSVLGQIRKYVGPGCALENITSSCIQNFLDSGKRAPITKKTYSTTLSPFLNWCIENGMMMSNPIACVRLPKVQAGLPKVLTKQDQADLIETIERYDRENTRFPEGTVVWMVSAIRITLFLGLRASELCQLRWEDIDYENKTVRIGGRPGFRTKNSKVRLLPLSGALEHCLRGLSEKTSHVLTTSTGRRVTARYLSVRFKHFARLSGLNEQISFHSLRHTACTSLIEKGVPIEVVRQFMGHSSVLVTQRYVHLHSADVHSALLAALES